MHRIEKAKMYILYIHTTDLLYIAYVYKKSEKGWSYWFTSKQSLLKRKKRKKRGGGRGA